MAAAVAGCGADARTIRNDDGRQLLDDLAAARAAFDEGACTTTLPDAIDDLSATVDSLPSSVGEGVQGTLDQAVARLDSLAVKNCSEPTPTTEVTTAPTTTFETITEDTTEETQTEEPEKTETEEPETEETETVPPEDSGPSEDGFVPPGQQKPPKEPKPPKEQGFFGQEGDE